MCHAVDGSLLQKDSTDSPLPQFSVVEVWFSVTQRLGGVTPASFSERRVFGIPAKLPDGGRNLPRGAYTQRRDCVAT